VWIEAILTRNDLVDFLGQLSPVEVALGKGGRLVVALPREVSMVPGEGIRVIADLTIHWPLLGVDVPMKLEGLTVLLRPTIDCSAEVVPGPLVFELHIDRAGLAHMPALLDEGVAALVNEELSKKSARLSWDFRAMLSHVFDLPGALLSAASIDLRVVDGKVKVVEDALGLALELDTKVLKGATAAESLTRLAKTAPAAVTVAHRALPWKAAAGAALVALIAFFAGRASRA
jgi:hypothetical protein